MNDDGALTQERAITEQVRQAFRDKLGTTTVARYPIEVVVQGATVWLRGTVDSQETKDTTEQLALSVPGVVNVINELVIDEDAGKGAGWLGGMPTIGAAGLANRGGSGAGTGTGQGGPAYPGVPLAAAELAGATENVPPKEGEEPGS